MGLIGAIDDMGPRADATLFVNRYLGARFEATPQLDPERELAAMCNAFFGPVGDHLNHYYLTLATSTDTPIDIRFGIAGYERIFTPEQIATARAHLQRALDDPRLAALPLISRRVRMVDLAQTYLERFLTFNWNLDKPDYDRSQQDARRIDEAIDALAAAGPHYIDAQDAKRRTTTSVMKGLARQFPDTMRFFRSWDLVGPFDNQQRDGMVVAVPLTRTDGAYRLANAPVAATAYTSPESFVDFDLAFADRDTAGRPFYAYAATTVTVPEARSAQLRTSSFHPYKLWLNGTLVYQRVHMDADCPDKVKTPIHLTAGDNQLVVMVARNGANTTAHWGFWLRVANADGSLLEPH